LFDGDEKVAELHANAAASANLAKGGKTPSLDEKGSAQMVEKL